MISLTDYEKLIEEVSSSVIRNERHFGVHGPLFLLLLRRAKSLKPGNSVRIVFKDKETPRRLKMSICFYLRSRGYENDFSCGHYKTTFYFGPRHELKHDIPKKGEE